MGGYSKILKQAYEITRQYKFLWLFGLFLILQFIFISLGQQAIPFQTNSMAAVGVIVFLAVLLVLSLRAQAGMIIALKALLDKQETSFGKAFKVSQLFFPQLLGIYLIVEFSIAVLFFLIASPIIHMFENNNLPQGITLFVLGLLIFIPAAILAGLVSAIAPMFVVIYDLKIKDALQRSFEMISKFWYPLTGWAILLGIMSLPALFLAQFMVGLRGGWLTLIVGLIAYTAIQSVVSVFQQTAWVLIFLDLIKPQKLEETEPVVAPEIVS